MNYRYHKPSNEVEKYVRSILKVDDFEKHQTLPVIPQGTASLIYAIRKKASGNDISLTLTSKPSEHLNDKFLFVCYFFRPFVAPAIFGVSAVELKDGTFDLKTLYPRSVSLLEEKLMECKNEKDSFSALDNFILRLSPKNRSTCDTIQVAVDWLLSSPETTGLSVLLKKLNTNERTLQRLFKKYVGISPVQFRRLSQFQDAFQQLRKNEYDKLSDIAFEHGYADQSHLTRSFREFINLTPKEYLKRGLRIKKE